MTTPFDHALRVAVEARIEALHKYRRWFLNQPDFMQDAFADLNDEYRRESAALIRLRRQARMTARTAYLTSEAYDRRLDHIIEEQRYPVA